MLKISKQTKDAVALLVTASIISGVLIGFFSWILLRYGDVMDKWFRENGHLLLLVPIFAAFIIWAFVEMWIMEEDGDGKKSRIKGLRVMR